MTILAHVSRKGVPVADVTYRAGMHVEVRVAGHAQLDEICFPLSYSVNGHLKGSWERALDHYFNEGRFDFKGGMFPGEMPRVGCARDHKCLFREAVIALMKDLEPHGFLVEVEFL